MSQRDIGALVVLAAIWGASFMFMRILSPAFGPVATACFRVLIGGGALMAYFAFTGFDAAIGQRWQQYLVLAVLNAAIPFSCYAFAALHLPAGYSAILNATVPFYGALFGAIWLGDRFSVRKAAGLLIGACGVMFVVRVGQAQPDAMFYLSVAACLVATCCYALAGIYLKLRMKGASPLASAGASQLFAGLMLLPGVPFTAMPGPATTVTIGAMLMLALVCSGLATVLYFRLIANIGVMRATTVTFLIPVFAMLWGWLLLGEPITPVMLGGCLLVVGGTWMIVRVPLRPAAA